MNEVAIALLSADSNVCDHSKETDHSSTIGCAEQCDTLAFEHDFYE